MSRIIRVVYRGEDQLYSAEHYISWADICPHLIGIDLILSIYGFLSTLHTFTIWFLAY